jgi:chaperonin GroEL
VHVLNLCRGNIIQDKILKTKDKDNKEKYELIEKANFKQILDNAGVNHNEVLFNLRTSSNTIVPNIAEETLVDAFESGIIDPTKVVRCALENAAAAAVTLLMTECTIVDKPTDKKKDEVDLSQFGM